MVPLRVDLRQVIRVLSDALDLVGIDDVQHGKRVALMAVNIARHLGYTAEARERLLDAALLHDCGVSTTVEHEELVAEFRYAQAEEHCIRGERLLRGFAPLAYLAPVVRYHHTDWVAFAALPDPPPPTVRRDANIIFLADRVDALVHQSRCDVLLASCGIRRTIAAHRDRRFAGDIVDAFLNASEAEAFWIALEPQALQTALAALAPPQRLRRLNIGELKALAAIFANIVDTKSAFTAEHSAGVSRVARLLAEKLDLPAARCDLIEVAGLLHDIGKLSVPDAVLEKPGPLNDAERAKMARHTFYTCQILSRIDGLAEIAEWAAFHHEVLTGDGYPFHRRGRQLPLEARVIAVADIFQALAQRRPYREPLPPDEIMANLYQRAAAGKIDKVLVDLVGDNLAACWQAAATVPVAVAETDPLPADPPSGDLPGEKAD